MSDPEDEPYSAIFTSLKHPVRRKILRMLSEKPRSFSDMLEASEVSSSHLTYHLESLAELVSKTDDGKYKLSAFGEAAVGTMTRVEEAPRATEPKHLSSLPIKWKSLVVTLLVGIVVLAALSYTQYLSFDRITREYGQLTDLFEVLKKGASFHHEYDLRLGCVFEKINDPALNVVVDSIIVRITKK